MSRAKALVLAALAAVLLLYVALNLRLGTDVTRFMPDASASELARLSTRLSDSPFTRTLVVSIGAAQPALAIAGARELAEALGAHPEVAFVRASLDEAQLEELYALYFPRRHLFLSDAPEREVPALTSEPALRERARVLRRRLASPASSFVDGLVAADPLGGFERVLERLRAGEPMLRVEAGQLVSADGRHAILIVGTRHSAFDSGAQAGFLDHLEAAFAAADARAGGGLELELSGAHVFAVAAERSMKRDVVAIAAVSLLGLAALFAALIGSLRGFLLVSLPPLAGILVATALGVAVFGNLDGLTMAFGASLMGVAVDYSGHLVIHQGLARPGTRAVDTERRLRPSLVLGALTTVASFGGLALTAFPAFREMSFYAAVGLLAALLAALRLLPPLLESTPPLPQRSVRAAAQMGRLLERLEAVPRLALIVPVLLFSAAAGLALPRLEWSDDTAQLLRFDPELVAMDQRVRERVARLDGGRFVIGFAEDADAATRLADRVAERLAPLEAAGALGGMRSLHGLLFSPELQRRNAAALAAQPDLAHRVERAFEAEGFRAGALQPFREALAAGAPEPLRLEALEQTPLGELLAAFVFRVEGRIAVVTHLRDLRDPERVRAAIADLDDVHLLDQQSLVNDVYRSFRETTLQQMLVGALLVGLLLLLRYRRWRAVLAASLPSLLVALGVLAALALLGIRANLLHVLSLTLVTGMSGDFAVFLVDGAGDREHAGATMLALLVACLTTVLTFGALALSSQPALHSIGITCGIGVALAYLFAPVSLVIAGLGGAAGASRG